MDWVAYAAGILDGEGCFRTSTDGHSPRVQVSMTDLDVLQRLQDTFGCGTIRPLSKRKAHWKDAWVWRCSGNDAARVMIAILPYVSARREQKMDEIMETWRIHMEKVKDQKEKFRLAAQEYLDSSDSLRTVARRHGVSYETVRRHVQQYKAR
jgi:hypothetical protein